MSARVLAAGDEVGEVVCELGEGPVWDHRLGQLRWVDIDRGLIHAHSPSRGQLASLELGQNVGFVALGEGDGLVAGVRDGFATVAPDGTFELVHAVEADRRERRMNDGAVDPLGRLWAGTTGIVDQTSADGALYRLDHDLSLTVMLSGLRIPNGIGWSPAGDRMYFTDTSWGRIDVFELDPASGELGERRVFVEIPAQAGMPDGIEVDEDGCVWQALWGGGAVHRYTPDGVLDTIVEVPARQVTSCAFGGEDRRDLFITTARKLGAGELEEQPRAGHVFACRPGAAGQPAAVFELAA